MNIPQLKEKLLSHKTNPFQWPGIQFCLSLLNYSDLIMDYDLDGYLKSGGEIIEGFEHYPDKYKLPNHITFSDESIYSGGLVTGGTWTFNEGLWYFNPSEFNLKLYNKEEYNKFQGI